MGAPLIRLILALAVIGLIYGCGKLSDETVRDKDSQRVETAQGMPGNDIPADPADTGR
jgi:hypothetical protein